MKQYLVPMLGLAIAAGAAQAADIGVSIQVGQPGFYGRIDIGNAAPPPVVLAEPVWVQRAAVRPQPIYLRVPPGHQKHWDKHCGEYRACGVPVYFIREEWYQERYGRGDEGRRGGDDHDHERGKGHGKGHGKGRD
ncbi:hypothetical protein RQP53_24420 [Paucibacter sp. APW11]|uniref:Uncharacterized protein n=1 Tax=Roseateles aquae TaxID=3077235 RepID=A0ABU3PIS3_9BURK|nr:hypothetical protein [Paucibacter sp. APW11]MDT9002449.1 hypothetical protein [Paucibacter sp. APW11]